MGLLGDPRIPAGETLPEADPQVRLRSGGDYRRRRLNFFWNFSTRPAVSTKRFSPV